MLVAEQLCKRYGDVVALDGCSLRADRGRIVGLLGPNGAGKSTAMRAVFGLVALDSGDVRWDDRPVGPAERASFGYMPEERGLYPKMRVATQLSFFAQLHGASASEADAAATRWLEDLGLGDRTAEELQNLSHGNQQRVQLAAALVHDPVLVVLDEPFAGLDPLGIDAMEAVLRRYAEGGGAVVFSSHQLDLVESVCDDVFIINRGRDVISGTLAQLRARSGRRHVEVAFDRDVVWEPDGDLPGAVVRYAKPGRSSLTVPADVPAESVLGAASRAGTVSRFRFEAPPLSELFREAVRS